MCGQLNPPFEERFKIIFLNRIRPRYAPELHDLAKKRGMGCCRLISFVTRIRKRNEENISSPSARINSLQ